MTEVKVRFKESHKLGDPTKNLGDPTKGFIGRGRSIGRCKVKRKQKGGERNGYIK